MINPHLNLTIIPGRVEIVFAVNIHGPTILPIPQCPLHQAAQASSPPPSLPSTPSPSVPGKEEWRKEFVNGSQSYLIKGLKPGTSYRVRVVARDQSGASVHSTEEHRITVPGEAAQHASM